MAARPKARRAAALKAAKIQADRQTSPLALPLQQARHPLRLQAHREWSWKGKRWRRSAKDSSVRDGPGRSSCNKDRRETAGKRRATKPIWGSGKRRQLQDAPTWAQSTDWDFAYMSCRSLISTGSASGWDIPRWGRELWSIACRVQYS